ncbi:GQ67_03936T0 [Komagataella phaffii]|nr:GQ67_03936T0 [Komagataella phaffii]AOA68937.1 GQ68_03910T0 [Komagataella phaffii GS115]
MDHGPWTIELGMKRQGSVWVSAELVPFSVFKDFSSQFLNANHNTPRIPYDATSSPSIIYKTKFLGVHSTSASTVSILTYALAYLHPTFIGSHYYYIINYISFPAQIRVEKKNQSHLHSHGSNQPLDTG